MTLTTVRCSALPRIWECTASKEAPEILIDEDSTPARLGSAVHAVTADIVKFGLDKMPPLEKYIEQFKLEDQEREFKILAYTARMAWKERFEGRANILAVEEKMRGEFYKFFLEGTADVIFSEDGLTLCILDWKSGRVETDATNQLMGYLANAVAKWPGYGRFKIITVWLRSKKIDVVEISFEQLKAWIAKLDDKLKSPAYTPGEHCFFCPKRFQCDARSLMAKSSVRDLMEFETGKPVTSSDMVTLYQRANFLQSCIDGPPLF